MKPMLIDDDIPNNSLHWLGKCLILSGLEYLDNFPKDIYGSLKINPTDAEDPQDFSYLASG